MSNRLEALEDWASGLLGQLEPKARRKLAHSLAQTLRRSQQQRIFAQQNPDGTKYIPRKKRNLRGKQGRVKQNVQMFQKLRMAKFFKVQGDGNGISIGFTGRAARIASVHQFGLSDRVEYRAPKVRYDKRKLLGFTDADLDLIRDSLLCHLTRR